MTSALVNVEKVELDPITLSVMDAGLRTAVAEMKSVVLRTAYSNLWREAGDLSCGLLDVDGDIVAQGVGDIPIHLASMPTSMRGLLAKIPKESLEPGDVLLQNDPYQGNNHMPDFIMAKPIFAGERLIAFAAVRGHYVDIGGPTPGSYNMRATDLYGEGLRVPPVKLYRKGVINDEIVAIISANVRNSAERLGDMRSQYAGCLAAERRLLDYCERYGTDVVEQSMREVLDVSETRARAAFREIPDGRYEFADVVDGDGFTREPLEIRVAVTIADDEVEVDFSGTSAQARGGVNSPIAVTLSATYFALKAVAEPHTTSNSGSYRPVTVITPKGTVINPHAPAPVVAGNHETAARIADVVLGALAQAVPHRVCAAGTGSSTVLIVSREGVVDDTIMYEVHGAAQGANIGFDGSHARRTSIGNTGNTPVEVLEGNHPIRVIAYELRKDAGGVGRHRGGGGITRVVEFTEEVTLTLVADRVQSRPYGLAGGGFGAVATFELTLPDGKVERLDGKTVRDNVPAGSVLRLSCAGAGGYGEPGDRPAEAIQADLDNGYISAEHATHNYRVTVAKDPARADGQHLIVKGGAR